MAVKKLVRIGFKLKYDQKVISKLVELMMEQKDCCGTKEHEDAISKLEDLGFCTKQNVQARARLSLMCVLSLVVFWVLNDL